MVPAKTGLQPFLTAGIGPDFLHSQGYQTMRNAFRHAGSRSANMPGYFFQIRS